jgi:hypothetical protein
MRNSIRVSLVVGVLTGAAAMTCANADSARELLFSAPVQQLDRGSDTVTVLGQRFNTPTAQLSVGEVVDVYGTLKKDGSVANAVVQATGTFGANGDPIFMKGVVTDTDAILGHATIDGMTVDYTAVLSNPDFVAPSVGEVVAFAGSQPAQQGVLMATAIGDGAYVAGTNGGATSFAAVTASGLNGAAANGGVRSAGMSGGGLNSAGMSGGGLNSAGMSGGGLNSAGMSGGGLRAAAAVTGGR